jgi:fructokinase
VTQVGTDELGERAIARMEELGMDMRFVSRNATLPTGTVPITFDEDRNPTYVIVPDVAYDAVPWTDALSAASVAAEIICFGTLAQRDERSRTTLRRMVRAFGGHTILTDINLRPDCYTEETVRWSLEHATIAKLNDGELREIADIYGLRGRTLPDVAAGLCAQEELQMVIVTLGEHGALAVTADGAHVVAPGFRVEQNDPCGAGDAFAGAFLASLEEGLSVEDALTRANALGALVAAQPGATQHVDADDMEELIASGMRASVPQSVLDFAQEE